MKLTEVLTTHDMIMSNIQTTSNNEILESGGMIHIEAIQDGRILCIADSNVIGAVIPSNRVVENMKLYQGEIGSGLVNWQNPSPLISDPVYIRLEGEIPEEILDLYGGYQNLPDEILANYWKVIPESMKSEEFYDSLYSNIISDYRADQELSYVFETNELGWLNIDKLLQGDNTEEVQLSIRITNREEFQTVFAKLVLVEEKSVVQGFESDVGIIVFNTTSEPTVYLPIESKAMVIVTAYRNRKPFYSIHEFTIGNEQKIVVELIESTQEELESTIEKLL